MRDLSNEIISSFGALFRLTVLQELFKECLTVEHLMVLFDHIPRVFPDQQLIVLQQLQQLFLSMSDWDITNLHARVRRSRIGLFGRRRHRETHTGPMTGRETRGRSRQTEREREGR